MLAVLWAGFACGVLDITAALVVYGYFRAKPVRLLQGIASGLLGPKAFQGGFRTRLRPHSNDSRRRLPDWRKRQPRQKRTVSQPL